MLCSSTVQETTDNALIAQMATLEGHVPVLHFFDGFRTSHEEMKIEEISYDTMRACIDDDLVREHRYNRLTPDAPLVRGTAQNPRRILPGQRRRQPLLRRYARHLPGRDGQIREDHRPPSTTSSTTTERQTPSA